MHAISGIRGGVTGLIADGRLPLLYLPAPFANGDRSHAPVWLSRFVALGLGMGRWCDRREDFRHGRAVRQGTTVVENYTEHVRKITPNG